MADGGSGDGGVVSASDAGFDGGGGEADSGTLADAGPDSGSVDGGWTSDCPGTFVLCEDFEDGIDAGTWTEQGAPALDTTRAHSGTHSILFSADNTLLRTTEPFPELANNLWGRVFVYMDQLPPGSTIVDPGPNASFAWAAGNQGDTRVGFRHTRYSGGYNYPGYDFTNTDSEVWPLDQWVCVEWHYQSDADSGQGTQDYWMNGVAQPAMHFDDHPMPAFTYFWIGMYLFGSADGGVPYEMWMDDLALDTTQVGCTH
jgi:hypothetical protein